jgi:hypothetical protein
LLIIILIGDHVVHGHIHFSNWALFNSTADMAVLNRNPLRM